MKSCKKWSEWAQILRVYFRMTIDASIIISIHSDDFRIVLSAMFRNELHVDEDPHMLKPKILKPLPISLETVWEYVPKISFHLVNVLVPSASLENLWMSKWVEIIFQSCVFWTSTLPKAVLKLSLMTSMYIETFWHFSDGSATIWKYLDSSVFVFVQNFDHLWHLFWHHK